MILRCAALRVMPCLLLPLLATGTAPAQPPEQAGPPVERILGRELARLDAELDLGTSPDGSALWMARLAASLERRLGQPEGNGDVPPPAPDLMRRLAVQLRHLGAEHDLVGPRRPGGPDPAAPPALPGPERAERAQRLRDLLATVELLRGKLERLAQPAPEGDRAQARAAPSNDDCSASTSVGEGTVSGSTSNATNDGSASCGSSDTAPDVWYRYTASASGPVVFDTFGSAFDTVLAILDGCPGNGRETELACNDDAEGTAQSRVILDMMAGEEVWVRLSGFGGASGSFDLDVTSALGIFGTVTRADTGAPLDGVEVGLHAGFHGYLDSTTTTDGDGAYFLGVPGDGSYGVRTHDAPGMGMIDEFYDDVPCCAWTDCWYGHTPIAVSGDEVTGIDLALTAGGTISGTVTSNATSHPLDPAHVYLYDLGGSYLTSVRTAADGSYEIGGLAAGKYYLRASADGYQQELYDDVPCGSCTFTDGTQVAVTVGQTTSGIDFTLDRMGSITGTVTEDPSGVVATRPVRLELYRSTGHYKGSVFTAEDGTYEFSGLPVETYYVKTDSALYRNQIYDGLPCSGNCDATTGTGVAVSLNTTTPGIDFSLVPLGRISGTVTHAVSGDPLEFVRVRALSPAGHQVDWDDTSSTGDYLLEGLETGDHYVRTDTDYGDGYRDELYDEQPCHPDCSLDGGTPVAATVNTTVSGIDFALDELGAISGTVTDAATGGGLSARVVAYDAAGDFASSAYASSAGHYHIAGLDAGTHHVATDLFSHRDEVYDDLPLASVAAVTDGTPVAVSLNATTPGIDFALDELGEISGTVTGTDTGTGLGYHRVRLYDDTGNLFRNSSTNAAGNYRFDDVPPGTYYVEATHSSYRDEVYDDLPCQESCDVTTGTAVVIDLGTKVTDIDFVLDPLGVLTGTVVEAVGGAPIPSLAVHLFDAGGNFIGSAYTSSSGTYRFGGLVEGTYYVRTASWNVFANELYDDLLCLDGCSVLAGTPVAVSLATTSSGVDFALARLGVIEGGVTAADTGFDLTGYVRLYDGGASLVATDYADASGFRFANLPPGTYYVKSHRSVTSGDDYQDELFADVPCQPICDLSSGTALQVALGTTVTGIELVLHRCPADSYEDLLGFQLFSQHLYQACERVTAGAGTSVHPGADVTLKAGRTVVLSDGFSVQSGGSLQVTIEPSWAED